MRLYTTLNQLLISRAKEDDLTVSTSSNPVITVKFLDATRTKTQRLKASLSSRSYKVYTYDHGVTSGENHRLACEQLLLDFGMTGDYVGGADAKGVYHFVDISGEQ